MKKITIITYTNSKCSDIWPIYYDLLEKYFPIDSDNIMICDLNCKSFNHHNSSFKIHYYHNTDPFYIPWIKLLPNIENEYFLYMQEDFFLYDLVNVKLFKYYIDILKENPSISCIRLLKSGIESNIPVENISTLYYVNYNTDYAFSMQPTIWKTSDFLKLQETKIQISPWDESKLNGHILDKLEIVSLYHYNNEPKRGMNHYDSNIFPYIATALVKGKWNTKEYPELYSILDQYKIDTSIRGNYT